MTIREGQSKYEWSQTDECVVVRLPVSNVSMKNIEVLITDLLLKVHAQSIKYFAAVDFLHEVDYKSGKNRTQLLDGRLEVMVMKATPGQQWASLENKQLTRQELMTRRNASVDRYYKWDAEEKA